MVIHYIFIPLLLTFAPWLIVRYVLATEQSKRFSYKQAAPYLFAATAIWMLALALPNVAITDQTDTTTMHTLGGVVASILFFFAAKAYGVPFKAWWQEPLALYFFVSGLGILNELLELFMYQTGILVIPVHQNDTWWDLLANTTGATIGYLIALGFRHFRPGK